MVVLNERVSEALGACIGVPGGGALLAVVGNVEVGCRVGAGVSVPCENASRAAVDACEVCKPLGADKPTSGIPSTREVCETEMRLRLTRKANCPRMPLRRLLTAVTRRTLVGCCSMRAPGDSGTTSNGRRVTDARDSDVLQQVQATDPDSVASAAIGVQAEMREPTPRELRRSCNKIGRKRKLARCVEVTASAKVAAKEPTKQEVVATVVAKTGATAALCPSQSMICAGAGNGAVSDGRRRRKDCNT